MSEPLICPGCNREMPPNTCTCPNCGWTDCHHTDHILCSAFRIIGKELTKEDELVLESWGK